MVAHLKAQGAFGVKMGPPVPVRRWHAATIKAAIAANSAKRLADVPRRRAPTRSASGWPRPCAGSAGARPPTTGGFAAGQPQYVFQVPLAGRDEAEVLAGFNQLWRRNIKKADKAGVEVVQGDAERPAGVPRASTSRPRPATASPAAPLSYFQQMWTAMTAEDPDRIRLYLARHEGDLVAATTMVRVGEHAWYSYGASSSSKRDVRGSNAIQWRMLRDARDGGRDGLRPARHHRHPRRERRPLRPDPVQARHRRRGGGVPR